MNEIKTIKETKSLDQLLGTKKPMHPVEIEQTGLKYFTRYASDLVFYQHENKDLYAFKENKLQPFLDFYSHFPHKEEQYNGKSR